MQNRSSASLDTETTKINCAFCQSDDIATYLLKETPNFRLVADHAPLLEGHLLIIPKQHYACYGAVPAELDPELFALRQEVQLFFQRFYAPAVFWEHGIFHQTVFHAHLHCFPFGETVYPPPGGLHDTVVHGQDDIRTWYATRGQYFYLEDSHNALLFAPNNATYRRIIQEVLWTAASARSGHREWRSPQRRQKEGVSLIEAVKANWRMFQLHGGAL
jgi:diadenosine tetraphosphate (Ap4A) HIT family hydrolase